jgi:hypothetical protein
MDELDLLREFGASTPLPTETDLAPTRAKLITAMRGRRPVRLPSWAWGGVAVAAAGAVAVAVVAWPAAAPVNQVAPAQADAVQILRGAATAALNMPGDAPRPDQFIYTKTQEGGQVAERWASADDTHDSLTIGTDGVKEVLPGCRNGRRPVINGNRVKPGETEPCRPYPAYLADLPTTADDMYQYLTDHKSGVRGDMHAMFKDVFHLAKQSMTPRARAALYNAASRIPGVRAVPNAKDAAGRPGVGIGDPQYGEPVIVFDATTYAYLGDTGYEAVLAVGIVDQVGQRP